MINSATAEQLMQVSGIGAVKADDIIAYRDAIGGFKSLSQLADISGIGDSLIQKIIEHFYPENPAPPAVASDAPDNSETPETSASQAAAAQTAQPAPVVTSAPLTSAETETVSEIPKELPTEAAEMTPVNVNTATAEEIADALLIDREIAEEIVALREKIHYLSNAAEIYEFCDGVDKELYQRIKSYLLF